MSASAHVEPNLQAGRGYARIVVEDELPDGFAPQFLIRRPGSALENLGPDGWQTAEHAWTPQATERTDQGLAMLVGPELVRHMENGNYRLSVFDAARTRTIVAPLVWRDIPQPLDLGAARTGLRRGRGGVAIGAAPPEPRAEPPIIAGAPPPPSEPLPPIAKPAVAPGPKPADAGGKEQTEIVPPKPGKWRLYAAIAAVLVVAAAAGVYFGVVKNQGQQTAGNGNGSGDGTKEKPLKNEPAPTPGSGTPMQQAQAALRNPDLTPQAAVALAKQLSKLPQSADAAFLLYDYAAEKGDAAAALALGGYYDPSSKADAGTIRKDGAKAAKYYRQAQAGGEADATARIDGLRAWAKHEAANGNQEAAKLAETL